MKEPIRELRCHYPVTCVYNKHTYTYIYIGILRDVTHDVLPFFVVLRILCGRRFPLDHAKQ